MHDGDITLHQKERADSPELQDVYSLDTNWKNELRIDKNIKLCPGASMQVLEG